MYKGTFPKLVSTSKNKELWRKHETYRQTNSQTDKLTHIQTDHRQADRHTDRRTFFSKLFRSIRYVKIISISWK